MAIPATSTDVKKVLIIEDYYALADIESLLCTMEGYEVKVAKSGDEGLAVFGDFQPDLVLLDLMLPGDLSGTRAVSSGTSSFVTELFFVVRPSQRVTTRPRSSLTSSTRS